MPAQHPRFARRALIAIVVLFADLMILHKLLAAGRRKFKEIWPGVFLTMGLWLVFGIAFGVNVVRAAGPVTDSLLAVVVIGSIVSQTRSV